MAEATPAAPPAIPPAAPAQAAAVPMLIVMATGMAANGAGANWTKPAAAREERAAAVKETILKKVRKVEGGLMLELGSGLNDVEVVDGDDIVGEAIE
jgi:hypothetical protein